MLYLYTSHRLILPRTSECCGQGAVGSVHALEGDDNLLYKEINALARTNARRRKLEKLADIGSRLSPDDPLRASVAWPADIVTDEDGAFTGFVLPNIKDGRTLEDMSGDPTVSSTMRLKLGLHLGRAIDLLLRMGVVVGDLSLRNTLYDPEAMRTVIIDPDSFQVEVADGVFCGVAESLEQSYEMIERGRTQPLSWRSDAFLYAIALHRLLFQAHPLDDAADIFQRASAITCNIETRRYPYLRAKGALPVDAFGTELKSLFAKSFTGDPEGIPPVADYVRALERVLEEGLSACAACGFDFPIDKPSCPACGKRATSAATAARRATLRATDRIADKTSCAAATAKKRATSVVRTTRFKLLAALALLCTLCACSPDAAAFVVRDVPAFAGGALAAVAEPLFNVIAGTCFDIGAFLSGALGDAAAFVDTTLATLADAAASALASVGL